MELGVGTGAHMPPCKMTGTLLKVAVLKSEPAGETQEQRVTAFSRRVLRYTLLAHGLTGNTFLTLQLIRPITAYRTSFLSLKGKRALAALHILQSLRHAYSPSWL